MLLRKHDAGWARMVALVSLLSTVLTLAFFACGPSNVYTMQKANDVSPSYAPRSTTGVLAVALANDMYFSLIEWGMKRLGTEYYRKVSTGPLIGSRANLDWQDPPEKLVLVDLPPGEYEFYQWVGYQISSGKLSIRFQVQPGVVNYIGRLYVQREGLLGYNLLIQDMSARDIPLIQSKLPNVAPSSIVVNIAENYPVN